jgi:hypothetical protein
MATRTLYNIIQLMTFHKVDTVIYQPRGSDTKMNEAASSVEPEVKTRFATVVLKL